jgi:beta-phosphoglucomutase
VIEAVVFDLDGTLVQTEGLKALSYARAAVELCPHTLGESEVVGAFKDVVGLSRREVALSLTERFGLEGAARARMGEFGVGVPWQAFVQMRLRLYEAMLADPEVLRSSQWPHNVNLLHMAREIGYKTALATMSGREQARRVLEILELVEAFDFVATHDDVEHGKPDPEIYRLVARELDVIPSGCLVIEDSPSGVRAAMAAGMWCIAVATPFTAERLHAERLLNERWIVDDPATLPEVVWQMVAERSAGRRDRT